MPVSAEHLSALSARERVWRSDAAGADVEAAFAAWFTDHRLGAPEAGVVVFAGHLLFGAPPGRTTCEFTETRIVRLRGRPGLRALVQAGLPGLLNQLRP